MFLLSTGELGTNLRGSDRLRSGSLHSDLKLTVSNVRPARVSAPFLSFRCFLETIPAHQYDDALITMRGTRCDVEGTEDPTRLELGRVSSLATR